MEANVMDLLGRVRQNVAIVVVGKENVLDLLLTAVVARGHVLLEDVPGIGKTTLVSALSRSLGLSYGRIQFTPDVMPSEITGYEIFDQHSGSFSFHEGMIMHQVVLADEINRASPKTQSALLEVMQENQVSVNGRTLALPQPFMVLATQNDIEQTGTYPLPEAQLDRFMLCAHLGYPSLEEEVAIYQRHASYNPLEELKPVVSESDVLWLQQQCREIYVAPVLLDYIARLAAASRELDTLELGASPRAALMLVQACRGYALIQGRDYVVPSDIKTLLQPVWGHRLILTAESRLHKLKTERIIDELLRQVPAPRAK